MEVLRLAAALVVGIVIGSLFRDQLGMAWAGVGGPARPLVMVVALLLLVLAAISASTGALKAALPLAVIGAIGFLAVEVPVVAGVLGGR